MGAINIYKNSINNKEDEKLDVMVSVIIPTYNRAEPLKKSIDSVLKQTYEKFEIIVIDDGSDDNTYDVIKNIKDNRIRYIKNEFNQGSNASRNIGINNAKGTFIAFQDSADIWKKNKLEKQMDVIERISDIDAVFCCVEYTTGNNEKSVFPQLPEGDKKYNKTEMFNILMRTNVIDFPSLLVRKKSIIEAGMLDEDMPRAQDWDLCIRLASKYNFYFINEVLSYGSYRSDSISADWKKIIIAGRKIIEKYFEEMQNAETLIYHITRWYHHPLRNPNIDIFKFDFEKYSQYYKQVFDDDFLLSLGLGHDFFDLQEDLRNKILKFKINYHITLKWLEKNILEENIFSALENKKVAIYGFGFLGKLLYEEIRKRNIPFVGVIDKNINKESYTEYKRIPIDYLDKNIEIDIIIVTVIWDFLNIKKNLEKSFSCEIISLEEILK